MGMTAYFLNVGQGDSTFIILPNGETMLVDCDITGGVSEFDSDHPTVDPVSYIADFLKEEDGQKVLDHLVITHPHEDHYSGFDMLFRHYKINHVWEPGHRLDTDDDEISRYYHKYEYILDKSKPATIHSVVAGRKSYNIGGATAYFFAPSSYITKDDEQSVEAIHTRSMVFKLIHGKHSILFTGDSDLQQWRDRIVPNYSDDKIDENGKPMPNLLKSSVLHASHHGSRTFFKANEESDPYTRALKKIAPDYTVISVGPVGNKHGHPHDDALGYYKNHTDVKVYLTRSGTTKFVFSDDIKRYSIQNNLKDVSGKPTVVLTGWVKKNDGDGFEAYPSDGPKLAKDRALMFKMKETNVPKPYTIRWLVQNNGSEALAEMSDGQWEHDRIDGTEYYTSTKFTGQHQLFCQIIQDYKVVALARYDVNIK